MRKGRRIVAEKSPCVCTSGGDWTDRHVILIPVSVRNCLLRVAPTHSDVLFESAPELMFVAGRNPEISRYYSTPHRLGRLGRPWFQIQVNYPKLWFQFRVSLFTIVVGSK